MSNYPLPSAEPKEINRVIKLYWDTYEIELGYDEAKGFLERVMQFVYLTEVEGFLRENKVFDK